MLKIIRYLNKKEWLLTCLVILLIYAQIQLELKVPEYMAEVTRLVQTPGSPLAEIWRQGAWMLLFTLASVSLAVVVSLFSSLVAAGFARTLRSKLFAKVGSFSMEEMQRFSTGSLITRSTNDIMQVQQFLTMGLLMMLRAPFMAILALHKIAGKGQQWYQLTGFAVAAVLVIVALLLLFVMPYFKRMQSLTDQLNRVMREQLNGLRVIRAYNAEAYQEAKFEKANVTLTRNSVLAARGMMILNPFLNLIMSLLSLGIYWLGAHLIDQAGALMKLSIFSDMVVFSAYISMVLIAFVLLTMLSILLPRAAVSARRINEVLDTEPVLREGTREVGEKGREGELEFRHVSFAYPDMKGKILEDISFKAAAGETLAIIGSTGSGKSSLVQLIPRFYDATEGEILVNGVNVREYVFSALHDAVGFIPQKSVIFSGTVASNVRYGESRRVSDEDSQAVREALEIAQAADFVEKMEGGSEAEISRDGENISGGQKQRLAIARAIARKPDILVFDDSFSALDYKTDRKLRAALKAQTAGITSVIVAQRIGTIMDADQILVLDEGRIVGCGKHRELLTNCPVYREIALTQFSEEELAS